MTQPITFIAADMDGTLLDENKQLPSAFFPIFEQLEKQNILFAAASGRQYHSLKHLFAPIQDKLIYIAENGTLVMYQGKELHSSEISKTATRRIIETVRQLDQCFVVLCGKRSAYIETDDRQAVAEISHYYHQCQTVDDLLTVEDDFIKIAILNFNGTEQHVYPIIAEQFASTQQVVISAKIWLDVMHIDASKGTAIKKLRDLFDFTFEQSMSFGDYFNDIEMLKATYHSYAMANAHPEIKKLARFSAPSNEDGGVLSILESKILSTKPSIT